jgi:F0F1-type ATP synthase assembly protein I
MSAVIIASSVAASTAAISASNSSRMEREKTEQCVLFVEGFDNKKSTVTEQKTYASCVQRLNPEPQTESSIMATKFCVTALLVAMVIGFVYGWKKDEFIDGIFLALLFPLLLALVAGVLVMVAAGIVFVIA